MGGSLRFVVLGTTSFTQTIAESLLDNGAEVAGMVGMPRDSLPDNSVDIAGFCRAKKLPYLETADINRGNSLEQIRLWQPDYLFSSWPRIIRREAMEVARYGCIGSHPTALPHNRGRHPLHWLMVLGIRHTLLSLFRMDQGVDSGNLLWQEPFEVPLDSSDINQAIVNMTHACRLAVAGLLGLLRQDPANQGKVQDHGLANYWRMRTPHDVTLDFRMSAEDIVRTVRSFAPPYPCAKLIYENLVLNVERAFVSTMGSESGGIERMEYGRVLEVSGRTMFVKAADKVVELRLTASAPEVLISAEYIHPPAKYLCEFGETLKGQLGF